MATNLENNMRRAFIDLGAGTGGDIAGYYKLEPGNKSHEVFAFEPNPSRIPSLKKKFPKASVYNAAAGTKDSQTKMYLGNHPNTSSLLREKVSIDVKKFIEVQEIDFCKWLKENFTSTDYITLVIDIEGGEYELLSAMHEQGLWSWINQLYVEFHGEKLKGFDIAVEKQLTENLIEFYGENVYIYRKHQHEKFLRLNPEGC